jgi:hypothetical protein
MRVCRGLSPALYSLRESSYAERTVRSGTDFQASYQCLGGLCSQGLHGLCAARISGNDRSTNHAHMTDGKKHWIVERSLNGQSMPYQTFARTMPKVRVLDTFLRGLLEIHWPEIPDFGPKRVSFSVQLLTAL